MQFPLEDIRLNVVDFDFELTFDLILTCSHDDLKLTWCKIGPWVDLEFFYQLPKNSLSKDLVCFIMFM